MEWMKWIFVGSILGLVLVGYNIWRTALDVRKAENSDFSSLTED